MDCLRSFKRACIGLIGAALFVLSQAPALAAGSCYAGIDKSSGAPEFIQCEREADCIDNGIANPWVVLILDGESWWGWAIFSTIAEAQDGARSRRPIHEPKGRTVAGPYPRCPPNLTASRRQDSFSETYRFELARLLVEEMIPIVSLAMEDWVRWKSIVGPALASASKALGYGQSLKQLFNRVTELDRLVRQMQSKPLGEFLDRADALRSEISSLSTKTNFLRSTLPSAAEAVRDQAEEPAKPEAEPEEDLASSLEAALAGLEEPADDSAQAADDTYAGSLEAALAGLEGDETTADTEAGYLESALGSLGSAPDDAGIGELGDLLDQVEGNVARRLNLSLEKTLGLLATNLAGIDSKGRDEPYKPSDDDGSLVSQAKREIQHLGIRIEPALQSQWLALFASYTHALEKQAAIERAMEELNQAGVSFLGKATTKSSWLTLEAWDHGKEDGDRVQILRNGAIEIAEIWLQNGHEDYRIELALGLNRIFVVALNEGDVGSNTASFILYDGNKKLVEHEWNLSTGEKAALLVYRFQ